MNESILKLAEMVNDASVETELLNLAGGETSNFDDPAELMLTLCGNNVFGEAYYDGVMDERQRKTGIAGNLEQLPPRARLLVATAEQVARGDNPRDLLALATWARQEANMRTTPAWMLAVAAREPKTKQFVVDYCRKKNGILVRPDDLLEAFKAYVVLYGAPLAACLKKGLAEAYTRQSEYGLVKYNPKEWPNHRGVLKMIDRRENYPLSKAMVEFLNSGAVIDEEALPLIASRKKLAQKTEFDAEAKELAKQSRATWENLVSHFGSNKEVWELAVEIMTGRSDFEGAKRTNYMALLRNLCNFAEAGISAKHWEWVYAVLTDEEETKRSKQLPFRYLAAYTQVMGNCAFDSATRDDTIAALDKAAQIACKAVFNIRGTSVLAPDHSGSMHQPIGGEKSVLSCYEAADVLAVIAFYASEHSVVIPFATTATKVEMKYDDGFFVNLNKLKAVWSLGGGTDASQITKLMTNDGIHTDRLIIFTDGQVYQGFSSEWQEYCKSHPKCWLHTIDLCGYGTRLGNQTIENERRTQIGGFSEKLLNFCVRAEVGDQLKTTEKDEDRIDVLPSMEYIRSNF
ncbi:MAG: TROVE domain protein [Candidatus Woesebacteria bacterium GW2011_GWB1_39_12]|uniref:TROVE domain protein n=1 Tax=Candidatus Woesebacteria bacterium GW2011_GWB1_39_12 TaxID=1618574 RepID=A0A0G0M6R7_9BACT|nr:MAG: TROVE domain protein [Candidatus Woesebacteria bacterium GW2011_GWB1_39_12]